MIYNVILGAFSGFGAKLLGALLNEKLLTKVFFYCARRLAKMTDTPIDDQFVEELYKAFDKDRKEDSNEQPNT